MSSRQKAIHPLHSQSTKYENLEMQRMSMSRLQNISTNWRQRHHEQPLGIPGHKMAFTPSSPMEMPPKAMLVTEVFVFKASASAWPKGKRLGSRSRLTSVRPHEMQRSHNSQFPTFRFRVSKQQIPLDSGQMSFTQIHFQPISCQYTSRKHTRHTTSYHTE